MKFTNNLIASLFSSMFFLSTAHAALNQCFTYTSGASGFTKTNSALEIPDGITIGPGSANSMGQIYYNDPVGVAGAWRLEGAITVASPSFATQDFDGLISFYLEADEPAALPSGGLASRDNIFSVEFSLANRTWSSNIRSPSASGSSVFGQVPPIILNDTLVWRSYSFYFESNFTVPDGVIATGLYLPSRYSSNGNSFAGVAAVNGPNYARIILTSWNFYSSACSGPSAPTPSAPTSAPTTAAPGTPAPTPQPTQQQTPQPTPQPTQQQTPQPTPQTTTQQPTSTQPGTTTSSTATTAAPTDGSTQAPTTTSAATTHAPASQDIDITIHSSASGISTAVSMLMALIVCFYFVL